METGKKKKKSKKQQQKKLSSGTPVFQPGADTWVCSGEQVRVEPGEPEFREPHLALLLGCLRREKSCCDLLRFKSHSGSLPAPGRAPALLAPADTELERSALPSSGECFSCCRLSRTSSTHSKCVLHRRRDALSWEIMFQVRTTPYWLAAGLPAPGTAAMGVYKPFPCCPTPHGVGRDTPVHRQTA